MRKYFDHKDSKLKIVAIYLTLLAMILFSVFPILNVVTSSLRPNQTLFSTEFEIIPKDATLENYRTVIFDKPLLTWVKNSLIISAATALIAVILATTAGYAFSRFNFWGKRVGMVFFLATQMFPAPMLLLPVFLMLAKLKLLNSMQGLLIPYVSTALPFSMWMLKGYYDTIPRELEQSAYVDGANNLTAFYKIILPLSTPAVAITALFSFMTAWSEYIVARVVLTKPALHTLPLGLVTLRTQFSAEWGNYAAAAVLTALPVMVLFILFSRYLISGLTLGSVKG